MRLLVLCCIFCLTVIVYAIPNTFHTYGDSFTHGATQSPNQWRILGVEYIVNHSDANGLGYGWLDDNTTYNTHGGSSTSCEAYATCMEDLHKTEVIGWGNGTTVFASILPRRDLNESMVGYRCEAVDGILKNISESNNFSKMMVAEVAFPGGWGETDIDHDDTWDNWSRAVHCTQDYAIKHGFKYMDFVYRINGNTTLSNTSSQNFDHPGPLGGGVMALELNRTFYDDTYNTTHFTYRTFSNVRRCMGESTNYCFDVEGLTFNVNDTLNWVGFEDVNPHGMTIKTLITNTSIPNVDVSVEMPGNWQANTRYLFEVDNGTYRDYFVKTTNSTGHMDFGIDNIGRGVTVEVSHREHVGAVGRNFQYTGVVWG